MSHKCPTCRRANRIVNECGCDPENLPTRPVTVNTKQELYVIPCGEGFTCLGFDVLSNRHRLVEAWLLAQGVIDADFPPEARGSLAAYNSYIKLLHQAEAYCHRANTQCPVELTPQLVGLEGQRVEVVDCDGERRRFQVGKSTGWMPCHLEIARRTNSGGPAVMGRPFQSIRVLGA